MQTHSSVIPKAKAEAALGRTSAQVDMLQQTGTTAAEEDLQADIGVDTAVVLMLRILASHISPEQCR